MQVFLTHLHSDHHADLATLYVGAMFGRKQPWEVWGPSGERPELGTAAAIAGLRQVCGCQPGQRPCKSLAFWHNTVRSSPTKSFAGIA